MNILLTGGAGHVGKTVLARLLEGGHSVRVIDRKTEAQLADVEYIQGDLNDYHTLRQSMRGCTGVIHLAALPYPGAGTGPEVFQINASGTFNVFQAAAEEGIQRIVQASSINALGLYYGVKPASPQYFPIDEEHPCVTTDAYSFSKIVVEHIGDYFWRREGISSLALRLPAVLPATAHARIAERRLKLRLVIDHLLGLTKAERLAWIGNYSQKFNDLRAQKIFEDPNVRISFLRGEYPADEEFFMVMTARHNFWTVIDERDSAQAFVKGLTASFEGSHALFVNDHHNSAGIESSTLLDLFYPEVEARKIPIAGTDTLVSIAKARRMIGFEPEYSFSKDG